HAAASDTSACTTSARRPRPRTSSAASSASPCDRLYASTTSAPRFATAAATTAPIRRAPVRTTTLLVSSIEFQNDANDTNDAKLRHLFWVHEASVLNALTWRRYRRWCHWRHFLSVRATALCPRRVRWRGARGGHRTTSRRSR